MPKKKQTVEDEGQVGTQLLDKPHDDNPTPAPREPAIGDWCWYWGYSPGTHCQPVPAQFIQKNLQNGLWHMNIHHLGLVGMQLDVPYTDTPKMGCWSWPE